jgi:signal peptidase II
MSSRTDNFRSPLAVLLFFGTTVVGLGLDLWTKSLAVDLLKRESGNHRIHPFIPGWLEFTYTENHGAVFGLGQGKRVLFIVVSLAAIAFLTYLFALSERKRFYEFLLGLLLAGVLGNMYDRIVHGYVRDMIHALPGIHWPEAIARYLPQSMATGGVFPWIFNVADSLLCVGVFLMIVYSLASRPGERPGEKPGSPVGNRQSAIENRQ